MNLHRISARLAIGVCLVLFFSCKKHIEQPAPDSLEFEISSDAAIVNEIANCKLRTVTHEVINPPGTPNLQITGTFVYHADGLPERLTYTNSGTGNPNYYFLYDNKRRLKELRVGYNRNEGGDGGGWRRYGYNDLDQITQDTLFNFTSFDPASATVRIISTLTYDEQGRVKTELENWYSGGTTIEFTRNYMYNYDSRGNLVVEGWPSSSYDNHKSIFRAHPLFQFLHRNYSNNNAAPQSRYNDKGFPLSNNPMNDAFFNAYPNNIDGTGITKATYDCDGFTPPNEFLYCKLRTIAHEFVYGDGSPNLQIVGTFVYHADGLPERLTYSTNRTGNPNYYFLYDNKRRLKELRVGNRREEGWPNIRRRYGYNHLDQITQDTLFNFMSLEPSSAVVRTISTITYDPQGRVKSETEVWYLDGAVQFTRDYSYNYDSRGNLIVGGWPSSSYDNNVSIFRSHSLFQFLHRNYSKNNSAVQSRYNSKGLPFSNNPMNHNFFNFYPNDSDFIGITKTTYDCP